MPISELEHVNFTVSNPEKSARMFCDIFDWKIRWQGESMNGEGFTYHVGTENSYVAIYGQSGSKMPENRSYTTVGGLNHIAVVVDDIDEIEKRVTAAGFTPHSHADYEPGKRFYFHDHDDTEIEVVSYS